MHIEWTTCNNYGIPTRNDIDAGTPGVMGFYVGRYRDLTIYLWPPQNGDARWWGRIEDGATQPSTKSSTEVLEGVEGDTTETRRESAAAIALGLYMEWINKLSMSALLIRDALRNA